MPSCSATVCGMLHGAELTPWDSAHECMWRSVLRRSEEPHCGCLAPLTNGSAQRCGRTVGAGRTATRAPLRSLAASLNLQLNVSAAECNGPQPFPAYVHESDGGSAVRDLSRVRSQRISRSSGPTRSTALPCAHHAVARRARARRQKFPHLRRPELQSDREVAQTAEYAATLVSRISPRLKCDAALE